MRKACSVVVKGMVTVLFAQGLLSLPGCQKDDQPPTQQTIVLHIDTVLVPPNAVADVSGNIYSTIHIGSQRWMAGNLRTSHYSNGDPIPYVPDGTEWTSLTTGAWSNYDCDAAYDVLYGKLYNWYTVSDSRNVCPAGWHVPTDADWMEMEQVLGVTVSDLDNTGSRGVAANAGGQMKADGLWNSPNTGATDSSGYSAFPSGQRSLGGIFNNIGTKGHWWSISEYDTDMGWLRELSYNNAGIYRLYNYKTLGLSIRCVED
ncbi:MAG: fibrobacter succinogenes major paralogous domain-containing protein [Flavobacteriales bacterium]